MARLLPSTRTWCSGDRRRHPQVAQGLRSADPATLRTRFNVSQVPLWETGDSKAPVGRLDVDRASLNATIPAPEGFRLAGNAATDTCWLWRELWNPAPCMRESFDPLAGAQSAVENR